MKQTAGFMVRLPMELKEWLKDKAEEHERSMNWMVVRMLENTRIAEKRGSGND